jgi:hypothetical protein
LPAAHGADSPAKSAPAPASESKATGEPVLELGNNASMKLVRIPVGNRCDVCVYPIRPHDFQNWKPNKANPDLYDTLDKVDRFLISLGWLRANRRFGKTRSESAPLALKHQLDL